MRVAHHIGIIAVAFPRVQPHLEIFTRVFREFASFLFLWTAVSPRPVRENNSDELSTFFPCFPASTSCGDLGHRVRLGISFAASNGTSTDSCLPCTVPLINQELINVPAPLYRTLAEFPRSMLADARVRTRLGAAQPRRQVCEVHGSSRFAVSCRLVHVLHTLYAHQNVHSHCCRNSSKKCVSTTKPSVTKLVILLWRYLS